MKVAASVILYHPDVDTPARIRSYASQMGQVYVFDNTEINKTPAHRLAEIKNIPNVRYFQDGQNKGLASRLNAAARLSKEAGFEWLLTMDQDSLFENQSISFYLHCLAEYEDKDKIAMFGVQYEHPEQHASVCKPALAPHLITSGSILNLNLFDVIGGFDEALFIDKVDHDYCLNARQKNFKLVTFENIFLKHQLGTLVSGRSIVTGKRSLRTVHSPLRMYYIFRNYFYLKQKYKNEFPKDFGEMRKELKIRFKNNLLYGKDRKALIKFCFRAYQDFRKNNMGKIENPF